MSSIRLRRHSITLVPESQRVIVRPFIPNNAERISAIIERALALKEEEVDETLEALHAEFGNGSRHFDINETLQAHYKKVQDVVAQRPLSAARQLLIGALFSGEYALESSALFNPSIVPHPDQLGVVEGGLRFIMSLRATGEGHISSIEFRAGDISPKGEISFEPTSRFVSLPEVVPNPTYWKKRFAIKLHEMGVDQDCVKLVMEPLSDQFTLIALTESVEVIRREASPSSHEIGHALECIQWLAESNYELCFSPQLAVSERIIFPVSRNECNGIEDARFVRFIDDDGTVTFYATYTAYNGFGILPQLIETTDFRHFRIVTLNGDAVQNKGMALFPRRINGRYAMLSRQDDGNMFIMFSDSPHHWSNPTILLRPAEMWESVKVGNCGSPIETEAGWIVLTHGVGPMRKYCIGAALLDLSEPTKVIGRLREPLLCAEGNERDGYVPNVVYSCGSLLHGDELILPYGMSDKATTIVSVPLKELIDALRS